MKSGVLAAAVDDVTGAMCHSAVLMKDKHTMADVTCLIAGSNC